MTAGGTGGRSRRGWAALGVGAAIALGVLAPPAAADPAVPASGTLTWSITPGTEAGIAAHGTAASAGRRDTTTIREFTPKRLEAPVNTVAVDVDATVPEGTEAALDVRGLRADGMWTEWTEAVPGAPAVLAESSATVQARLVVAGERAAEVRRVDVTAWNAPGAAATPRILAAQTYRVFATREGLVGGTTANGHVIKPRDHFVALPSRRGLANRNSGNYTVQVCTSTNSRCEWAPVWDVGPWNTKDDYWNANREMWKDLPRGKPQAQAAYQDGYNGGKDQFGRRVANPAGIDLADGTFWDGLKLSDNAWVNVTYEWTGSGPWGTIATATDPLNVRSGPRASAAQVGLAARHAQVRIECQVTGDSVSGTQGTSNLWYRLASGKYVARAYVKVGVAPGNC
ncbi:hypothetical protein SAMN05421810_111152 [Amycolatopsis arida]|uniref:Secreted protein n=1 Tax=Amycolatopsis arida TaxID=587909 RepID=A0A1I6A7R4_9PSEU|nr:hypothetical protein [Amycolatopsis arida]TDX88543.1 hypothetical protein CLV69_11161 [Amycolatopsis arida]SFQ64700.1 hypothetical protein SAMN05421810_111152 [Amycolatopsis arida]